MDAVSKPATGPREGAIEPAKDEQVPHLEDAATPQAKHSADEQLRGEWQRAGQMQEESDHLRDVLDDARQAVAKASDADSMAAGGIGVAPEDVQDEGSGRADGEDGEERPR